MEWRINVLFSPWRVDDRCSMSIGDCRGHIRASQGTFQNISTVDGSLANWLLSHIFHFGLHFRSNLKGSLMDWEVKNLLSCQTKHGLVGSSAKTRNFYLGSCRSEKHVLFWAWNIKVPFGMGHPPTCTSNLVYMCGGGLMGSQIFNRNSIILIHSRFIAFLDFGFFGSRGWGRWVGGI